MTTRRLLHGMVWETDIEVHAATADDQPVDFRLRLGKPAPAPDDVPPGELLAHLAEPGGRRLYSITRAPDGVLLRFHGLCEFHLSPDLSSATFHPAPGVAEDFGSVLASGMLASTVLLLRGQPVLHGSAVQDADSGLALVGASGMGKSTLSALMCRTGSALITDDVLVVQPVGDGMVCRSGGRESRLRAGAAYLVADRAHDVRATADGRTAYAPESVATDRLPLRAVAIPYPTREVETVSAEWLTPRAALLELLRFPRIMGWVEPLVLSQHFSFLGRLVQSVPVARLRVPWSEHLDAATADQLRACLRLGPPPG